jgi:hypothetical protein
MPVRVQRSRKKGWRMPPDTICVTRPGRFANYVSRPTEKTAEAHAACVEEYRTWIMSEAQAEVRQQVRRDLHGKNLACYCPLDLPCHADVLLEIANGGEG